MPIDPIFFTLGASFALLAGLAVAQIRPATIVDFPKTVLALIVVVSLAAVAMLVRIDPPGFTIDVDPASEPLIGRSDPGIPIYRDAVRDFGNDDIFVVAMHTETDVFTRPNLETIERITQQIRRMPGIAEVESIAWVLSVRYDPERDLVEVARLMDGVPPDAQGIAALRARALADPVHRKTLISADARTTAINITFQPMTDGEFVELDLDGRIEAVLAKESGEGQTFFIAGRPHVRAQAYHIMVRDMATLVPIAVLIAALTLWLMSGSVRGVLLPLSSCLTATLWVFGAMAAVQIDINLITLVLASMMICVGSVYGVHVFARYEVIAATREDTRAAALECLRYARTPVLMAGFTTCIGFAALLLTDAAATNELGIFSILGVSAVTLLSLTAIPAALVLFPGGASAASLEKADSGFGRFLDQLLTAIARMAIGRSGTVLAIWVVMALGAVAVLPRITIDTDVITFFAKDSRVRTDFSSVNRLLTGAVPIYVMVSGDAEGSFRQPETLRAIEALQSSLGEVDGVSQVLSSVDLIRLVNRAMHNDSPEQERVPDTREAVAEATFLLPKAKLRRFATSNHSRGNLIVRTGQSGSKSVRALEERIRDVLAGAELPEGFESNVTGNAILINRSADGIASTQATQVGFAAGTIFLLICAVFRSIRIGLVSIVPNVIPVLLFFGLLGTGVAPLSLPTSLIGSIALGIAIDDTMHFLVAYRARRSAGATPEAAARECILQVGRPIIMTSIMLVVGFLVILASGFATLQEFGYLTAITMALCLTTDLILLPALLVRLRA